MNTSSFELLLATVEARFLCDHPNDILSRRFYGGQSAKHRPFARHLSAPQWLQTNESSPKTVRPPKKASPRKETQTHRLSELLSMYLRLTRPTALPQLRLVTDQIWPEHYVDQHDRTVYIVSVRRCNTVAVLTGLCVRNCGSSGHKLCVSCTASLPPATRSVSLKHSVSAWHALYVAGCMSHGPRHTPPATYRREPLA